MSFNRAYARRGRIWTVYTVALLLLLMPRTYVWSQDSAAMPVASFPDSLQDGETDAYWDAEHFKLVPVDRPAAWKDTAALSFPAVKQNYTSADFNYDEHSAGRLSWWQRLKDRVGSFLRSMLPEWSVPSAKTVLYALAILGVAALAYVAYRLFTSGNKAFFRERSEYGEQPVGFIEQNLETTDIQPYLEAALAGKDYNLAVRFLYLISLQALARKKIIVWDYRKTNRDFLSEINADGLRKSFGKVVRVYEYVWFGNFRVDALQFRDYEVLFEEFQIMLNETRL